MKVLEFNNLNRENIPSHGDVIDIEKGPWGQKPLRSSSSQRGFLTRSTTKIFLSVKFPLLVITTVLSVGCPRKYREDLDYSYSVQQTLSLDESDSGSLVQFESVNWDADDQAELRSMIVEDEIAAGRSVLHIGVGPGLISILCQQHGANGIVGTDTHQAAVANAQYNAAIMEMDSDIKVRHAKNLGCFAALQPNEKFDLIIVDSRAQMHWPASSSEPDSPSIELFLDKLLSHSRPGGRCIVATHRIERIEQWQAGAVQREYESMVLGDRDIDSLLGEFYPALLLEIRVPMEAFNESADATTD